MCVCTCVRACVCACVCVCARRRLTCILYFIFSYVLGTILIRTSWQDAMWRQSLEKADLFVEPLPRILLAAPKAQAGRKRNVNRPKTGGFPYLVAHQGKGSYHWNYRDPTKQSWLRSNVFPNDNQFISGVPVVRTADKLRFVGTDTVCRPQENSLLEVPYIARRSLSAYGRLNSSLLNVILRCIGCRPTNVYL